MTHVTIVRAISLAGLVCLAGGVIAGVSAARADDCALASAAAIAQAGVPHADTHVTTVAGKPPASAELIFTGDKVYTQINGSWTSMAYSAQQQIDIVNAAKARAAQTPHSCRKQGGQMVNGQAASVLTVHSEESGKVSDARVWIADATGLPLKSEIHLANGTVITDDFRYDNIAAPPGAK